jgi:peptidoglycan biosynthesis protein MviN/MurJ (putative lipid II flippase)
VDGFENEIWNPTSDKDLILPMEKPDLFPEPAKEISRAALKVSIGGGLSLIAGLASQVITAYLFGAGAEMDAFFTASTIPLYLQIVLLGGDRKSVV